MHLVCVRSLLANLDIFHIWCCALLGHLGEYSLCKTWVHLKSFVKTLSGLHCVHQLRVCLCVFNITWQNSLSNSIVGPLSKCEDHLVVAVFRVNKKTEHQHVQNRPSKCYFTHLCKYNIDWAHIAAPFFFPPRFYKNACLSFACPWTDLDFQLPPRIIPLLGVICAIYMYPLSWFQTTCPRRFYRGFSGRCIILFRMPSFRYLINSNNIL